MAETEPEHKNPSSFRFRPEVYAALHRLRAHHGGRTARQVIEDLILAEDRRLREDDLRARVSALEAELAEVRAQLAARAPEEQQ